MATLIPGDLDLDSLHPESERRVIRQLLISLGDEWQVIPKVGILLDSKNAEIDIVLASRHRGVFVLEVKGGIIALVANNNYVNNDNDFQKRSNGSRLIKITISVVTSGGRACVIKDHVRQSTFHFF